MTIVTFEAIRLKFRFRKRNFLPGNNLTSMIDESWQLKTHAFPKARRSLYENIVSFQSSHNDFSLKRSKDVLVTWLDLSVTQLPKSGFLKLSA
jgi:hypothetical protein